MGFDVIFGMEWLTSYDAQVNCGRKCLRGYNEKRVNVRGENHDKKFCSRYKLRNCFGKDVGPIWCTR